MSPPDKRAVLEALLARVRLELQTLRQSQREAQEGAIHEETRQEDPKDTRAIEAQYIARGLAERVEELQSTLAALARIPLTPPAPDAPARPGSLIGVDEGSAARVFFLVPAAGGETLEVDGHRVQTLTPHSPLGQALIGLRVDDDVDVPLPSRRLHAVVEWIR